MGRRCFHNLPTPHVLLTLCCAAATLGAVAQGMGGSTVDGAGVAPTGGVQREKTGDGDNVRILSVFRRSDLGWTWERAWPEPGEINMHWYAAHRAVLAHHAVCNTMP